MRQKMRMALSVLLTVALLASLPGAAVLAADPAQDGGDVSARAEGLEIGGGGPVGDMVASVLTEEMARTSQEDCISGLSVSGTTATVTCAAGSDADLVVAVYEEGRGQMMASGRISVGGG